MKTPQIHSYEYMQTYAVPHAHLPKQILSATKVCQNTTICLCIH